MVAPDQGITRGREFHPVQRALARQWLRQIALAGQHPEQRIVAQLLVIVQVFVAQRQSVNALRQHLVEVMLDPRGVARVGETARHAPEQVDLAISLAQQQPAAVGGQPAALEPPHHPPRKMRFKWELRLVTLCHEKGRLLRTFTTSRTTQLSSKKRPFSIPNPHDLSILGEKSGLAALQEGVGFALPANCGGGAMAGIDKSIVGEWEEFALKRAHDVVKRAAPEVRAPDAAGKQRVAGE